MDITGSEIAGTVSVSGHPVPSCSKIVVLTDLHYAPDASLDPLSPRIKDLADILLLRAVHRINNQHCPDLTLIMGDIIDDGNSPRVSVYYRRIREILDLLKSPWIVIPGNHDAAPDLFYTHFPRPPEFTDIAGVRYAVFLDPEAPGFNAVRSQEDLSRMDRIRADGWDGPVVALQHVPVFPPDSDSCPYAYTNIDEVLAGTRRNRISLSIAGHYHAGIDLICDTSDCAFAAAPALCESPFSYLEFSLSVSGIEATQHCLQMPPDLHLRDFHVHTPFAYCSENMDIRKTLRLANLFGLDGIAFSEHSGHLYFDRQKYWSGECLLSETRFRELDNRMDAYWKALEVHGDIPFLAGLEIDCRYDGSPLVLSMDEKRAEFKIAAIHGLGSLRDATADSGRIEAEFMHSAAGIVRSGVHALAHPFRVFRKAKRQVPRSLFRPLARMLQEHHVAAEINFHTNLPDPEFFRICMEEKTPLILGSDAHNLYEIGEFSPHLKLLASIGFDPEQLYNPIESGGGQK